jgi:LCP family protein required for cell wall assembly
MNNFDLKPPHRIQANIYRASSNPNSYKRPKRRVLKVFFLAAIIILIVGILAVWKGSSINAKIFGSRSSSFISQISNLITNNQNAAKLTGEDNGEINILLLGYGGAGHDGPFLTDSMVLASIRPNDKKILLTSIPRDYYFISNAGEKINAAFTSGFIDPHKVTAQDLESGGVAAGKAVSTLSEVPIPYFISMDFQGFIDAINRVGGIEVNVANTFTDDQYPNGDANANGPGCTAPQGDTTSTCRYIEVHFNAGLQTMNGQTALEYTRSRHADGAEGSDFARSRRQQLVLEAFKSKVTQLNLFTNVPALNDLINILTDHLHTNLSLDQANHLAQIIRQPGMQVVSQSFDPSTNLVCPDILPTDGAYIVKPCAGVTMDQIAQFFQNGLPNAPVLSEHASVILENASTSTVNYNKVKKELTDDGARVYPAPYHDGPTIQNAIYVINNKSATVALLESELGVTAQPLPANLKAKTDLVVIIAN